MKYEQIGDGVWEEFVRNGYRDMCCDCGLVHIIDFRLMPHGKGYTIQVRSRRDRRATAAARRGKSQQLRDALKKEHE